MVAREARRVIGILGGMGPLATVDLYRKIIAATPARRDQDHLHVIIDADPAVPDRTEALLHGGPDPTPLLRAGALRLAAAGVDFIVVPCNTAHAFLPRLAPEVPVPFLSLIDAAADAARAALPASGRAGVLATEGTIAAGLYQEALAARGIEPLVPNAAIQAEVSEAIRLVKAGETGPAAADRVLFAAADLAARGAQVVLAACTELPLVLDPERAPVPVVDPTWELARLAVRVALGEAPLQQSLWEAGAHGRGA